MAMPTYQTHAEVPAEYAWRLTDIYPSVEDWEAALDRIQTMIGELVAYRGRLAEAPGDRPHEPAPPRPAGDGRHLRQRMKG